MSKSTTKSTVWDFMQRLGQTFMLPVALFAFSGILLGIGSSLSSDTVRQSLPLLDQMVLQLIFQWMTKTGQLAFVYLPVLFAMAIPLGLAREEKGVAAFAGFVGYGALNVGINFYLTVAEVIGDSARENAYGVKSMLGISAIDTGILGAIIVGVMVAWLHNRCYRYRLPDALAFFGGVRLVSIITLLVLGCLGLVVPLVWPWIANAIKGIGTMIAHAGPFGPMLYGTVERLLLPLGLHHILVALIRFTDAGGYQQVCGANISGALNIFYAELACADTTRFTGQVTAFLAQGKMPVLFGGLPGAALAMYHSVQRQRRREIRPRLISGVVASVIGGITEPLEFLFLFVAPALYVIHAILNGVGFMTMALLGVTIGNTEGSLIDLLVFGVLQGTATRWYLVPAVAAIWFVVYYSLFRFAIARFDLKIPGREAKDHNGAGPTGQ